MGKQARLYLREWRQRSGLSHGELAEFMDLTVEQLIQLEAGLVPYTPWLLQRLSRVFDIEVYRLFLHPGRDARPTWPDAAAIGAALRQQVPELVARLNAMGLIDDLLRDRLSDEYWQTQGETILKLIRAADDETTDASRLVH